jgi:hypothetical protein
MKEKGVSHFIVQDCNTEEFLFFIALLQIRKCVLLKQRFCIRWIFTLLLFNLIPSF